MSTNATHSDDEGHSLFDHPAGRLGTVQTRERL